MVPNETCPTGSSLDRRSGVRVRGDPESRPGKYDAALFFADYSRDCIWVMPKGADGNPVPGQVKTFVAGAANPVNLETGPGDALFYVDFDGGTIRRIDYTSAPRARWPSPRRRPPPDGAAHRQLRRHRLQTRKAAR